MPLKAINPAYRYKAIFGTIGPVREKWIEPTLAWIDSYCRQHFTYRAEYPPRLKFEIGDTGHPHFHLGMFFRDREKFAMFNRRLQIFLRTLPDQIQQGREYSVRLFSVPEGENLTGGACRGPALVDHYFDSPTKIKDTLGASAQVFLCGWNPYTEIAEELHAAKQSELDLDYSLFGPDYKAWLRKFYVEPCLARAESYAKFTKEWYKYMNTHVKNGMIYPEITRDILHGLHENTRAKKISQMARILEMTQTPRAESSTI